MMQIDGVADQPKKEEAGNIVVEESMKVDEPVSLAANTKNVEAGKDPRPGDQISSIITLS
jgi:hypothetical protein